MYSIEELQKIVKEAISEVRFPDEPRKLYEPISYTLNLGGKRLRPVLCLMATDAFGGNIQAAIPASMGIEIFHNFTLIHDDIMDNAPIRRGKATVYLKWDSNVAILSGDTMFAVAYRYVTKTNPMVLPQVLEVFNQTAIEVCEGQQYDMDYETMDNVSIADYMKMIRLKTAVLLGGSLKAGAVIANAPEQDTHLLYDFGINIGLAFQLKDDYLDCFGDEGQFGKKTGGDIMVNKKTWMYIKALELAQGDELEKLKHYFGSTDFEPQEKVPAVLEIYKKLKVDILAESEMEAYYNKGIHLLDQINLPEDRKTELRKFAVKMIQRDN
ncbi:MAG: polyprenyl synthetase family protein [Bacteroidales bacterium]|nr:polyprenyl synthetase family protein [Bacteroidales bacterium]